MGDVPNTSPTKEASPPTRWSLRLQAIMWRYLMEIGMVLHRLAPPRPPSPAFSCTIPTTISPRSGRVTIKFYTPPSYRSAKKLQKKGTRFPVVVNFHGGGFTLGAATDDARWAACVVKQTGAVVASVDYRLAPEFPFPTAVEDGVDAVLYVARCAEELWLDPNRIAISGFSCGGNLAFTVPLRLWEELDRELAQKTDDAGSTASKKNATPQRMGRGMVRIRSRLGGDEDSHTPKEGRQEGSLVAKPLTEDEAQRRRDALHPVHSVSVGDSSSGMDSDAFEMVISKTPIIELRIASIVSFYPSCDYSLTRDERRETLAKKDMELSPIFTTLFDHSYLPTDAGSTTSLNANPYGGNSSTSVNKLPSNKNTITPAHTNQLDGVNQNMPMNRNALAPAGTNQIDRSNPYLSPGKAAGSLLADALPDNIVIVTCEWDMLQAEAMTLKKRLEEMDLEDEEDTENLDPHDQNSLAEPVDGAPAIVISEDSNNDLVKHQAHRKKRRGKRVVHRMVKGAPHGWDKHPNPWKEAKQSQEFYSVACAELKRAFTLDHASANTKGNV